MSRLWSTFSSNFDQLLTPVREAPTSPLSPCETSVETGLSA
jgi:hypothetical protein